MAKRKPLPKSQPRPKLTVGRPTKLTPEVSRRICKFIKRDKAPLEDAAAAVGVGRTTLFMWLQRGRAETAGAYREFLDAVELSRAAGTAMVLGRIAAAAKDPKHWQANVKLLELTERRRFGAQVRIVQEELDATLDRLEQALTPAEFDRVLAAIASDSGRAEAGEAASIEAALAEAAISAPGSSAQVQPVGEEGDATV